MSKRMLSQRELCTVFGNFQSNLVEIDHICDDKFLAPFIKLPQMGPKYAVLAKIHDQAQPELFDLSHFDQV